MRRLMKVMAVGAFISMGAASVPALAGRGILVDQGDNYPLDGQKWDFPGAYFQDSFSTVGSGTVTPAIPLNIGAGAQLYTFRFDPTGRAVMLDSNGVATTNFIAPLESGFSDVTFIPDSGVGGFIAFGAGQIAPSVLTGNPVGPFDPNAALSVYRFLWRNVCIDFNGACVAGSTDFNFEAVLVDRGAGDFDLDFDYAPPNDALATSSAGYLLGANAASFTDFSSPGPDYCFRGGVGQLCGSVVVPPTTVPEPAPIALLAAGIGLLGVATRRRRGAAFAATAIG